MAGAIAVIVQHWRLLLLTVYQYLVVDDDEIHDQNLCGTLIILPPSANDQVASQLDAFILPRGLLSVRTDQS